MTNIAPIYEKFIGSDGNKYIYIYYIGVSLTNKILQINNNNLD